MQEDWKIHNTDLSTMIGILLSVIPEGLTHGTTREELIHILDNFRQLGLQQAFQLENELDMVYVLLLSRGAR